MYLLSFLLLFFPPDLLGQICRVKTNIFVLFFPLGIYENMFQVIFYLLLFFMGTCFKFYLKVIERMSLEHCGGCLFWPRLLLMALNLARIEACVVPRSLCAPLLDV